MSRRVSSASMKTNAGRSLEVIADDIRALERSNAFTIGALLAEAREDAEYGKWSEWLESEFDWSEDTARNYIAAHRLGEQFRTVRNLPLPMRATFWSKERVVFLPLRRRGAGRSTSRQNVG